MRIIFVQRVRGPWLGLAVALGACSRSGEVPPPTVLRLTEIVSRAEIHSAFDLTDRDALLEQGTVPLDPPVDSLQGFYLCSGADLVKRVPGVTSDDAGRIDGERSPLGPTLRLTGAAAVARVLPDLGDRHVVVRARVDAEPGADFRIVVMASVRRNGPDNAAYHIPDLVQAIAAHANELRRIRADDRGGDWYSASFQLTKRYSYTFGLFVREGTVKLLGFDLRLTSPLVQELTEPNLDFDSPWVRRVDVSSDMRESIVLVTPATISFPVRIPARGARLEFAVAPIVPFMSSIAVRVAARRGDVELCALDVPRVQAASEEASTWQEVSFDLAAAAGRDVDIVFSAVAGEGDLNAGVALASPTLIGASDIAASPDVVVVSLDTVRADRLSLYGYDKPTTPRLIEIGRESAVFSVATASSSWTLPSHTTLFSGLLPDRHGVDHVSKRIGRSVSLLAEEFRAKGYRTVAVTGGGYVQPSFGFGSGFDEYRVRDPALTRREGFELVYELGQRARRRALDLIRSPHDRPLFLFVHTYVAHEYIPSRDDLSAIGVADDDIEGLRGPTERKSLHRRMQRGDPLNFEDELQALSTRYDATLRSADALAGDVFDAIRASERADRTYLVVVSDHGEEFGEHTGYGHGHDLYEELIRVPLVWHGPGIRARRLTDVVSLADVAPTLRSLCGLPAVPGDGRDLSILFGGGSIVPAPVMAAVGDDWKGRIRVLRGERWKLRVTDPASGARTVSLFDLSVDGESRDLAEEMAERAEKLTVALDERVRRQRDAGTEIDECEMTEEMEAELKELGYLGDR